MVGLLVLAADGHEAQLAQELEQLIELDQLRNLGANVLLFGPPGVCKSHLVSALGLGLIDAGRRVLLRVVRTWCSACGQHGVICGCRRSWPDWTGLTC